MRADRRTADSSNLALGPGPWTLGPGLRGQYSPQVTGPGLSMAIVAMPCTVHVRCNYVAYFCPGQHCDDTTRHDGGDSATGRRRLDNDDTSTQATNDNRRQTTRPDETCIATQRNRLAGLAGRAQAGGRQAAPNRDRMARARALGHVAPATNSIRSFAISQLLLSCPVVGVTHIVICCQSIA